MKKLIFFLTCLICVSCFNEYDEKKDIPNTKDIIPVEIIKAKTTKKEVEEIEVLTEDEKNILSKNEIDIKKFSKILSDAQAGNKESMIAVASVYKNLNMDKSFDKIVDLAIEYKVTEIIETKVIMLLKKNQFDKAENLLKKIKKNKQNKILWANLFYQKGFQEFKNKNFKLAAKNFEVAYQNGLKEASIQTAYSYANIGDKKNTITWFEKAHKNKDMSAGYELAVIYFNDKKYNKALPLLLEQEKIRKNDKAKVVIAIAISYAKLKQYDEATIWFKKADKLGIKEAKQLLDEMNSNREGSYNVKF